MVKIVAALLLMTLATAAVHHFKFGNRTGVHKSNNSQKAELTNVGFKPLKRILWIPANTSQLNISTCPIQCKCDNVSSGLITDCSNRKLVKIPEDIPVNTVTLLLSNNRITHIGDCIFAKLTRVLHIDMAYNGIERLNRNSFFGLSTLKTLSLAFNRLEYTDSYPSDVFAPLRSLTLLYLNGNCDEDSLQNCAYLENAIPGVKNVEVLYLDGIPLGPGFKQLVNLSKLIMSSGYCVLNVINTRTFMALSNTPLQYLDLKSCDIQYVEPNTFSCLRYLEVLIMSDNGQLCEKGLHNITTGIDDTAITELILEQTCHYGTRSMQLRHDMFRSLLDTSLVHLDLSSCHIDDISAEVVKHFPDTLKYIVLKDNAIHKGSMMLVAVILKLPTLEYLDASLQLRYMKTHNKRDILTNYKTTENYSHVLEYRTAQRNKIYQKVLNWFQNPFPIPPKLKFLNASFIKVEEYDIPAVNISTNNSLEVLDISNNVFKAIQGRINGLHSLRILNMSNNLMEFIQQEAFGDMKMLQILNLSGDRLGMHIMTRDSGNMFSSQTKLEKLFMSSNLIKALPKKLFSRLTNLRELYLQDNALGSITVELGTLSKLEILDLSGNSLKDFSIPTQNQLQSIAMHHRLKVDIRGNSLACSCDQQDFLKWLYVTSVEIIDKEKLSCKFTNYTFITLTSLPDIENQLFFECNSVTVLAGCAVTFIGLLIVFGFVFALCSQRWKLKYLYFLSKRNINPYHPIQEDIVQLQVDAYMSFDEDYNFPNGKRLYEFVSRDVYGVLQARGLTIKLRHELIGGQMLHDVITSAIRQSRKVVVFLTSGYCKDFWNTFEFNLAAYEGIYTKRNVIIPVVVGPLQPSDLLPEIIAYLKNERLIVCPMDGPLDMFFDVLENRIRQT